MTIEWTARKYLDCIQAPNFTEIALPQGLVVTGDVFLDRTVFLGSFYCDDVTFNGDFFCDRATFNGDFHCNTATFNGSFYCDDAVFNGAFNCNAAIFTGSIIGGGCPHVAWVIEKYRSHKIHYRLQDAPPWLQPKQVDESK